MAAIEQLAMEGEGDQHATDLRGGRQVGGVAAAEADGGARRRALQEAEGGLRRGAAR